MTFPRANRVQRPRKKGSPLPEGAVWAGRGSLWSNPFFGRRWGHAKSVILHRRWLNFELGALTLERMGFCPAEVEALFRLRIRVLTNLHRLAECDLACSCPLTSPWCHVDTVLDLVPAYAEYEELAA